MRWLTFTLAVVAGVALVVILWRRAITSISEDDVASVPRVAAVTARSPIDQHAVVAVDVRDADSYAHAHIPGALNIPLDQIAARAHELPRGKAVIAYCT